MRKITLLVLIIIWTNISAAQEVCIQIMDALAIVAELCAEADSLCLAEIDSEGDYSSEILSLSDTMATEDFEAIETVSNEDNLSFALIRLPFVKETLDMFVFGNTRLENRVAMAAIEVLALRGVNLRVSPSLSATVIASLLQGHTYKAIGRLTDNTWIRVRLDNAQVGWVSAEFLRTVAGFAELTVVSPNTPAYLPMQAFKLETQDECSALLLISPQNETVYEVAINGLVVQVQGVAIVQTSDENITVATLAGENTVSAFGFEQIVAENEIVSVALSESGMLAGIPSEAAIYTGLILPYELFVTEDEAE
jgi:uncharacterized protein YgiM (DUF1202 family)